MNKLFKTKKWISIILVMSVFIGLLQPKPVSATKKISISKKALTITEGKSKKIKLKNANKNKVKWSSSNKKVAVVNKSGKITAKKKGSAKITATYFNKKYVCKVTVKRKDNIIIPIDSLTLKQWELTIEVGEVSKLETIITPENATDKSVIWQSLDDNIATVDKNGNVKGMSLGTTTITVIKNDEYGNGLDYCEVNVVDNKPEPTETPSTPTPPSDVNPTSPPSEEPTPTNTPIASPTSTPISTVEQNYNTLIHYINTNGNESNSSVDKYISGFFPMYDNIWGSIQYHKQENRILFGEVYNEGNENVIFILEVDPQNPSIGNVGVQTSLGYTAEGVVPLYSLTGKNKKIVWTYSDAPSNELKKSIKQLGESTLAVGLIHWSIILKNTGLGLQLNDLGFTSFNG